MPKTPARRTTATATAATSGTVVGTALSVSIRPANKIIVDTLVVGVTTGAAGPELATGHGLPASVAKHLTASLSDLGATGRLEELTRLARVPEVAAKAVLLVGLGAPGDGGEPSDARAELLRRAIGGAVRSLGGTTKAAVCVPGTALGTVTAVAEGVALGAYAVSRETTNGSTPAPVTSVILLAPGVSAAALRRVVVAAQALAEGVTWCRDLVNSPPNLLYPETFAAEVRARFAGTGVRVRVLDEVQLARGGYGGIVGVGQGSARPPRLVVLSYGPAASGAPVRHVALVGKGITFDSGGLSIKPRASMPAMKSDMSGAAAVAGTVLTLARLKVPVRVTAYLALAENMPGSNAQRAGDVVTMRGGMTVEVLDPDAEGRMVLGDAMALAGEQHPDLMIDIATLTGAQVVALDRYAAVMSNDGAFREQVCAAAGSVGEEVWPMPLPDYLRASLDTPVADIAHKGGANGGMLAAGLFLKEFVGTTSAGDPIPWAHIDIAGPAFNTSGPFGYTPKGGTGFGVRTMLRLVTDSAT